MWGKGRGGMGGTEVGRGYMKRGGESVGVGWWGGGDGGEEGRGREGKDSSRAQVSFLLKRG